VVFIRSIFYGAGAGAVVGALVAGVASIASELAEGPGPVLVVGGFGAVFGVVTGLLLCIVVLIAGHRLRGSGWFRVLLALLAMTIVYCAIALLFQAPATHPIMVIFVVSSGVTTWFLLPIVIRPVAREQMPRLRRQSP
jgi:hypothetical protein